MEEKIGEISVLENMDKKEKSVSRAKVKALPEDSVPTIGEIKNLSELFKLISEEEIKKKFKETKMLLHADSIFTNIKKVTLEAFNDSIFIHDFKYGMPFDADFFSKFQSDSIQIELSATKFKLNSDSLLLKLSANLNKLLFDDSVRLNMSGKLQLMLSDSIRINLSKELDDMEKEMKLKWNYTTCDSTTQYYTFKKRLNVY